MTEENTKPEGWIQEYDELFGNLGSFEENETDKINALAARHLRIKAYISSLLASQRHQLKEQVLEAVGSMMIENNEQLDYSGTARNPEELKNNLIEFVKKLKEENVYVRLKAVFEKEI